MASNISKPVVPDHKLLRLIGRGSYGEVWLAQSALGHYRAVKVVYRDSFDHDRPFEREFQGLQKFEPISRSHESQVDILHVGRNEREGYFYYVMELADDANRQRSDGVMGTRINGAAPLTQHSSIPTLQDPVSYSPQTLRSEIKRRGRLPLGECLHIGLSLTTALDILHRNGLVHRDIKPSNIIFIAGLPKLADIGLVTHTDATRSFVGTEGYLPPEGPGSPPADIFSLGKVLFEASTGQDCREFPGLPIDLKTFAEKSGLLELNEIILKACAPDVKERYPSAQAMRDDLLLLEQGKSVKRKFVLQRRLKTVAHVSLTASAVAVAAFGFHALRHDSSQSQPPQASAAPSTNTVAAEPHGLTLIRKIELPGVWRWSEALVGKEQGTRQPITFLPNGATLLVFARDGKLRQDWPYLVGRTRMLNLDLVSNFDERQGDQAILSWTLGPKVYVSVLNQNMHEAKRFATDGMAPPGEFGNESLSIAHAQAVVDLAGDGRRRLLASIGTGAKLKPRGVYCFDYEDQSLLWHYPTAPYVTEVKTADLNGDHVQEIVVGSHAVDNHNTLADGTSDAHSYLYALKADGSLLWFKELGDFYTLTHPLVVDLEGDGSNQILVWITGTHEYRSQTGSREIGAIVKLDARGKEVVRYDPGVRLISCETADLDEDGKQEILATDRQGFLHVLNSRLNLIETVHLVTNRFEMVELSIQSITDLDQDGWPEIILTSSEIEYVAGSNPGDPEGTHPVRRYHDNSILILNRQFKPVARHIVAEMWSGHTEFKVQVADFNGDGKPDILSLADEALVLELK